MSKADQVAININLSESLANYIIGRPDLLKKFVGCSYVLFEKGNDEFNEFSEKLIESLQNENRIIIKATKTFDTVEPWIFNEIIN